jgi:hypothetical protein
MANLDSQHKSHDMGLHQEQLAGRTQQVFFSPEEGDNFLYPESFDVDPGNTAECAAALQDAGTTYKIIGFIMIGMSVLGCLILGIILKFMKS